MEDFPLLPHAEMVYNKMFIDCRFCIVMEMDNNDMLTGVCTDKMQFLLFGRLLFFIPQEGEDIQTRHAVTKKGEFKWQPTHKLIFVWC